MELILLLLTYLFIFHSPTVARSAVYAAAACQTAPYSKVGLKLEIGVAVWECVQYQEAKIVGILVIICKN